MADGTSSSQRQPRPPSLQLRGRTGTAGAGLSRRSTRTEISRLSPRKEAESGGRSSSHTGDAHQRGGQGQ